MTRWLTSVGLLFGLAVPAFAQLSPEKALATMKPADGMQVELFAAEPMLLNPTAIDVDHLGRVWVAEAVNYRRKNFNRPMLREAGDRIVILADKNGDGKADESTVFYQGKDLYGPLSVLVLKSATGPGYRVLVAQSPDILEFTDADGDGKADGPPAKFLTGFGGFDHDHGVHGLTVGPDGKLYFTVGDAGLTGLQSSDKTGKVWKSNDSDLQKGTVWRCDLDGKNVELIAHNFRNNYEACVDSFGEVWLSDNDDDGNQQTRICFVMPGGNYGYGPRGPGQTHWHEEQPGIVHKTLRTGFGSPTGICFNEGKLFGEKYLGALLHCDAGPREVRAFFRKPKGAGYELDKEVILTSSDNFFRPSDVCVAPDGSIFVADWYDRGVGGHGMGDPNDGRIYRLTPKGHKGYAVPATKVDSKDGLVAALASPNLATRVLAISKINTLPVKEALDAIFSGLGGDETLQARNHWLARPTATRAKPEERDDRVRVDYGKFINANSANAKFLAMFVRSLPGFATPKESPGTTRTLPPEQVAAAREILLVMRNRDAEAAKLVILNFAKLYDGQDIFYRAALNIACGTDPVRRDAILADFDKHFPEWNDKVADLVWELRPKSVLPRMEKLLADEKITATQKGRIVDILASSPDAAAGKTMLSLLKSDAPAEVKTRAIDNLKLFLPTKWNAIAKSDDLKAAVAGLLQDPKTTVTGLQLISAANYAAAVNDVIRVAGNGTLPTNVREEAIATLGKIKDPKAVEALIAMLTPKNPLALASVRALGEQLPSGQKPPPGSDKAAQALHEVVLNATASEAELKTAALNALAGNRAGTGWLLKLKEDGKMPSDLIAQAGRLLRNSPFQGERNKALLLFPAPGKMDVTKLPALAELAKRKGNAESGKAILARSMTNEVQCLKCHTIRGQGGQIGPDLSMIGKKGSRENLFESILFPSKAIADQYVNWKLDTEDGQSITGIIVQETPTTLTLRDANGKDYNVPVKGTDKKKSPNSLMADNLVNGLTEDDLVDVVEYLTTLQTASLTPDAWHVVGPFADDKAVDVTKFDPAAKFATKAGQQGWRTVRVGAGNYVDLAAFHGKEGAESSSFAYREIESPAEQSATIFLGTDDGAKLWVNGEEVFKFDGTRAAAPEQNSVKVTLKKGTNAILLKVSNGNNPHGFYLTVASEQELKAK